MNRKRVVLVLGLFIILISVIGAYASEYKSENGELNLLLDETDGSSMYGCCSIACQLDGNESILAFRRDAPYEADIHIEKINWHGKEAIKQYKDNGGYFCQVIITNDGWTIGYGGLDDGEVSQQVEDITGEMVEKNKIDNATLEKIQAIKQPYKRGHVLIKAPDGEYGVAMATTHFSGKLKPGDYISVPNKPEYVRSGDIQMNASDKTKIMHTLEINDGFGIERRDITTFYFHPFENDTFKGNITNMTISNDDGSVHSIKDSKGLTDDVILNGATIKGDSIPIAPKYKDIGSFEFLNEKENNNNPLGFVIYLIILALFMIIFILVIKTVNRIRYARKLKKRRKQYQSLYRDDRYRYR